MAIVVLIILVVLMMCQPRKSKKIVENYKKIVIGPVYNDKYSYNMTSSANTVEEGQKAKITINRQDSNGKPTSGTQSTVYISTTVDAADEDDYEKIDIREIKFGKEETTKTIEISTKKDNLIEKSEYFYVDLYKSKEDAEKGKHAAWTRVYIKDNTKIVTDKYKYKITSNADTIAEAVEEGQKATITIIRQDSSGNPAFGTTSTVVIKSHEGTAYEDGEYFWVVSSFTNDIRAITFGNEDTTKTIEISTNTDNIADDREYFWVDLFENEEDYNEGKVHEYTKIFIKNKTGENVADKYTYSMTSSTNTKANEVEEGQNATITITRDDSGTKSTVYISTTASSADEDDYEKIEIREITFGKEETTKTINISTKTDNIADDGEYFLVDLFKSKADAEVGNYATYITIFIKNKISAVKYNYSMTSSANTKEKAVKEGQNATITITRDDSGTQSTVYISTTADTAEEDDYEKIDIRKIKFGNIN